jgi:hypothetical protein
LTSGALYSRRRGLHLGITAAAAERCALGMHPLPSERSPTSRSCGWQIHHRACNCIGVGLLCIQSFQLRLPESTQYRRVGSLDLARVSSPGSFNSPCRLSTRSRDSILASRRVKYPSGRVSRPKCRFRSFQHQHNAVPRWQIDILQQRYQQPSGRQHNSIMAYSWNAAPHSSPSIGLRRVLPGHHARGTRAV